MHQTGNCIKLYTITFTGTFSLSVSVSQSLCLSLSFISSFLFSVQFSSRPFFFFLIFAHFPIYFFFFFLLYSSLPPCFPFPFMFFFCSFHSSIHLFLLLFQCPEPKSKLSCCCKSDKCYHDSFCPLLPEILSFSLSFCLSVCLSVCLYLCIVHTKLESWIYFLLPLPCVKLLCHREMVIPFRNFLWYIITNWLFCCQNYTFAIEQLFGFHNFS